MSGALFILLGFLCGNVHATWGHGNLKVNRAMGDTVNNTEVEPHEKISEGMAHMLKVLNHIMRTQKKNHSTIRQMKQVRKPKF